ncbi:hypothetical protein CcI156_14295 [Frankia sp. CcI156]|nr:hypothetical protein CgIS1_14400 [Frankia sp. CgIS1]ONH25023.1 hypothetical protein CcI156_14295 [Frankia sp. CcI156]
MVEGQRRAVGRVQVLHRPPAGPRSIPAGLWLRLREIRQQGQVGHADHPDTRVAVRAAVGPQLLEVTGRRDARLGRELPQGRGVEILVAVDETTGQRPASAERGIVPADDQDTEPTGAQGQ